MNVITVKALAEKYGMELVTEELGAGVVSYDLTGTEYSCRIVKPRIGDSRGGIYNKKAERAVRFGGKHETFIQAYALGTVVKELDKVLAGLIDLSIDNEQ